MADEKQKVLTPDEIPDTPFPQSGEEANLGESQGGKEEIYTPATVPDTPFPKKVIAQETVGASLNTKSKKILAEYSFTPSGSIKVGELVPGESGDLKISPDGIVARNKDGDTTFAIDGDTGDATFRGNVQAKDFQVIDENGLISSNNFNSDSINDFTARTTTSGSFVDIDFTTLSFHLDRAAKVFIMVTVQARIYDTSTDTDIWTATIPLNIDGLNDGTFMFFIDSFMASQYFSTYTTRIFTMSTQRIKLLDKGDHTIKLVMKTSGHTLQIIDTTVAYIILGT